MSKAAAPSAVASSRQLLARGRQLWRRWRRVSSMVRRGAVWGVPVALIAVGYGVFVLSGLPAGQAMMGPLVSRFYQETASLGLVVNNIEVQGRETTDVAMILKALAADRGTPILAVSPSRAKQQLEALPWVRSAAIERRLPSTIYVRLVERHPLAVWQHAGKQELIGRDGEVIPVTDLSRFPGLPTVVGENAAHDAAELLATLAHEPALASRVTAAVEVDGRRWNVRVDNAVDVLLPEEDPGAAWSRLAAMDRESSVLKREVVSVDLRLPDRVVLRTPAPPPQQKEAGPAKSRPAGKNT